MKTLLRLMMVGFILLAVNCKKDSGTDPPPTDTTKTEGIPPDETIKDGNVTVYNYSYPSTGFDISFVSVPDTMYYIYMPVFSRNVTGIGEGGNWRYLINASYFDETANNGTGFNAKHVDWLKIYGTSYEPISEDKQLTHVVSFNRSNKNIRFSYYKDFVTANDNNSLEFQTGPLVVENNKLADTYINSSINYWKVVPRTLLASTDNNQTYFVIVRSNTNLTDIGNFLLKLSIFKGKRLDVVNLDGGQSTALYSKNYSRLNFNNDNVLPFFLAFH